jgi:hypothetical protein
MMMMMMMRELLEDNMLAFSDLTGEVQEFIVLS